MLPMSLEDLLPMSLEDLLPMSLEDLLPMSSDHTGFPPDVNNQGAVAQRSPEIGIPGRAPESARVWIFRSIARLGPWGGSRSPAGPNEGAY